jgi:hypothetical protein
MKKAKGTAWAVWRRLQLDPLADRICASVAQHQHHDPDWAKNYIKHPATYLTGRCWEDEFPTASAAPQPQRRGLVL